MGNQFGMSGTKYMVADGEILARDNRIRVFNINVNSGAGGGGIVEFRNGGAAGDIYLVTTGTVSTGVPFEYGDHGIVFTDGCYVNMDANVDSITVTYRKEA